MRNGPGVTRLFHQERDWRELRELRELIKESDSTAYKQPFGRFAKEGLSSMSWRNSMSVAVSVPMSWHSSIIV